MKTINAMTKAVIELKSLQRALSSNPVMGFNVLPSVITELEDRIK